MSTIKSNLKDTIDSFNTTHNFRYDYSLFTEYKNNKQYIKIICKKHQNIFSQRIDMHKQGQGCQSCKSEKLGNLRRHTIQNLIIEFNKVHNYEFDYSAITEFKNVDIPLPIGCKKHGIFLQSAHRHLRKQSCPKCYNEKRHTYLKSTKKEFVDKANIIHNNRYKYPFKEEDYKNCQTKIEIECEIHGIFLQTPNSHLNGCGCPHCFTSNGEKKIFFILKGNQINFITQKTFDDCKYKSKLRFDFYLPDYNICVEYNGQQHFTEIKNWGGKSEFDKIKIKDKIKNDYCKTNKIKLLNISHLEYDNIFNILKQNLNEDIFNFEIESDIFLSYNDAKKIIKDLKMSQTQYNKEYKNI